MADQSNFKLDIRAEAGKFLDILDKVGFDYERYAKDKESLAARLGLPSPFSGPDGAYSPDLAKGYIVSEYLIKANRMDAEAYISSPDFAGGDGYAIVPGSYNGNSCYLAEHAHTRSYERFHMGDPAMPAMVIAGADLERAANGESITVAQKRTGRAADALPVSWHEGYDALSASSEARGIDKRDRTYPGAVTFRACGYGDYNPRYDVRDAAADFLAHNLQFTKVDPMAKWRREPGSEVDAASDVRDFIGILESTGFDFARYRALIEASDSNSAYGAQTPTRYAVIGSFPDDTSYFSDPDKDFVARTFASQHYLSAAMYAVSYNPESGEANATNAIYPQEGYYFGMPPYGTTWRAMREDFAAGEYSGEEVRSLAEGRALPRGIDFRVGGSDAGKMRIRACSFREFDPGYDLCRRAQEFIALADYAFNNENDLLMQDEYYDDEPEEGFYGEPRWWAEDGYRRSCDCSLERQGLGIFLERSGSPYKSVREIIDEAMRGEGGVENSKDSRPKAKTQADKLRLSMSKYKGGKDGAPCKGGDQKDD